MNYLPTETPNSHGIDLSPPSFKGMRLAKKTIKALEAMAYEGLSLHVAADRTEIRRSNLQRAFESPKVKQTFNQIIDFIQSNAAQAAYLRMVDLAQNAKSEHVRADCNKWMAGVDGIAPIKRVQSQNQHAVTFGGFDYGEPMGERDNPSTVED